MAALSNTLSSYTRAPTGKLRLFQDNAWLILGFVAVLGLMVTLTLISLNQMNRQVDQLNQIVNSNMAKIEIVAQMHAAARERTLIAQRMLVEDDPFLLDSEGQRFSDAATLFIRARQSLQQMPLSEYEEILLEQQGDFSKRVQPLQMAVVAILQQNRNRDSARRLLNQAIPIQDNVLAVLDELFNLQRQKAREALSETIRIQTEAQNLILSVLIAALLLGIAVAAFVVRRTYLSNRERSYLATHDTLTSLPNRLLVMDRIEHAIARAKRQDSPLAIMFIDLDRFKIVNDSLGHKAGDELLVEVANRLRDCVRSSDTVARLGGDEFIVLIEDAVTPSDATTVAKKITTAVARPLQLGEHEIFTGASIGIAVYPESGTTTQDLIKHADTAMYHAKEAGRNNFQFYSQEMSGGSKGRLAMEAMLRQALGRGEIVVHYQPQANIQTGQIVGMEALVRWQHPELGLLQPSDFLGIAEEAGLITDIGNAVLRQACADAKQWHDHGFPECIMAVNLSGQEFWQPDLIGKIDQALKESALKPELLEIELTEGILMRNSETASNILHRLKELGIHLSMDDFGTGYSSLARLKTFPLDLLKIDRSFISDLAHNDNDAAITSAIIAIANRLKFGVIAEGVETKEQLAHLSQLGCEVVQGYLISPAVPAEQAKALLVQGWRQAATAA